MFSLTAVLLLALLPGERAQMPSCTYTSPKGGPSVTFTSMGTPQGSQAETPLGTARLNPCTKVQLCDSIYPNSICCVQVNGSSAGSATWVSCGTSWKFTTQLAESSMMVGMILTEGANCGYVFAPNAKVTASIAFTCSSSAGTTGKVSASRTGFMNPVPGSSMSSSLPVGGSSSGPKFDPAQFCNLNFTWSTSTVCNLPTPAGHGPGNWGLAILLIVAIGGAAYFGGFTYYRSTQPGSKPEFWKNMHAYEFWSNMPGLIKDGVNFVASGGQPQYSYTQYAQVSDVESAPPKKKPARRKTAAQQKADQAKAAGNAVDDQ